MRIAGNLVGGLSRDRRLLSGLVLLGLAASVGATDARIRQLAREEEQVLAAASELAVRSERQAAPQSTVAAPTSATASATVSRLLDDVLAASDVRLTRLRIDRAHESAGGGGLDAIAVAGRFRQVLEFLERLAAAAVAGGTTELRLERLGGTDVELTLSRSPRPSDAAILGAAREAPIAECPGGETDDPFVDERGRRSGAARVAGVARSPDVEAAIVERADGVGRIVRLDERGGGGR